MKKFKRLIALLTVAMFIFSFAAPAMAAKFTDVSGSSSDDVYKLNALGIINGYPDGTFKPDANITRAEFVTIAMAAAGMKSSADYLKSSASKFKDVKAGEWFTGWVNLAVSQGYIAGYPDGSFKPNANITYAEAITILVRLLGYTEKLPGVWPTEYLVKAADLGITDGVAFGSAALATRGNIAVLTSHTLDQTMVSYDKDTEEFVDKQSGGNDVTLLDSKFDGVVVEDKMVENVEYNADGEATIEFADADAMKLTANVVINNGDFLNLEGKFADYITVENSDHEDEVAYINVLDNEAIVTGNGAEHDVTVTTAAGAITEFTVDGEDYTPATTVTYFEDGAAGVARTPAQLVTDGDDVTIDTADKVTLVIDDNKVVSVNVVTDLGTPNVAKTVTADKLKIEAKQGANLDIDETDKDYYYAVVKDGQIAKFSDIKADDVYYVLTGSLAQGLDKMVYVFSAKATGKVDSIGSDGKSIYVDGKKYKQEMGGDWDIIDEDGKTMGAGDADLVDLIGTNVTLALDAYGKYASVFKTTAATGTASSSYIRGVVVRRTVASGSGYADKHEIKIFTEKDQEVVYPIKETYFDDNMATAAGNALFSDPATPANVGSADIPGRLVKFSLNDKGEIKNFEIVGIDFTTTQADYTGAGGDPVMDDIDDFDRLAKDADGSKYYLETGKTVIFDATGIAAAHADDSDNEVALGNWKSIEDATTFSVDVFVDDHDITYLVINEGSTINTAEDDEGIYLGYRTIADGDQELSFFIKGAVVKYIADAEDASAHGALEHEVVAITLDANKEVDAIAAATTLSSDDGTISDLNSTNKLVETEDGSFKVLDDTVILDHHDQDINPAVIDFGTLQEDWVVDVLTDSDGNAKFIVVRDIP